MLTEFQSDGPFTPNILYMIIEPVHLLTEVKCQYNSYTIVYLKSVIRNYSIAGKKEANGLLPKISHYLTLPYRNASIFTR